MYFTAEELAQRFHRTTRTIRRWQDSRGFPAPFISGRGTKGLWRREEVEAWEASDEGKQATLE